MVNARLDHPDVLPTQLVCSHDGVLRPVGPEEGVALNGDGDWSEDVGDDDGLPFLPEQIRLLDPLQLDVRPEKETRANVDEKVGGLAKRLQECANVGVILKSSVHLENMGVQCNKARLIFVQTGIPNSGSLSVHNT